ncbi:hypothetical protein AM501_19255 [Aneurinibacillus migulanus]|uniref:Germination protein, Ger(X)C family n=1 Tax=Aneurinibacillus migulanus TaxID=47500 RepID=A0A0D1XC43_ANEMI|nr:Ger(x)C family spore germination protein [Aneurinibacillus migulanus]KIV51941.1 hypothetical protein TS65_25635 [Aneurinibacillus migulanus]KIV54367.1 hypothetical protein TS64_15015 [Aneurinibacillus migulanus]KON98062.1 hypothetical protein AF333_24110 [Aneurinibacillus migulanus]KPD06762.1 hypothetical protein AM501_19255 [Aneurinibacillus migulanus]MCP1354237.1 Ger(x)C family spore germination protein [Aneurinibacillus migulanus]
MKALFRMALLAGCILLGGCAEGDRKVLDELGLFLTAGYDEIDQHTMRITCIMPAIQPEGRASSQVMTVAAHSGKEARKKLSYLSGRRAEPGQLKVVIFGEETARHGIASALHPIYRDPSIGSMIFVGVVKGKAYDALKVDGKNKQWNGLYLYNVLQQEEKLRGTGMFRLGSVIRDMETPGRAVAVPYIVRKKEGVLLDGMALFNHSRMTGKLPSRLLPMFAILNNVDYREDITFILDKRTTLTLSFVKNSRTRRASYNSKTQEITIHIKGKVKGQVLEYKGEQIRTKEHLQELEKKVARSLEQDARETVAILQKARSDALGLGSYLKARNIHPGFSQAWWDKQYPQIDVKVEMEVELTRLGLLT